MTNMLSRLEHELVLKFIAEEHPVFHVFSAEKNNSHAVSVPSYSLKKETIVIKKSETLNAVFLSAAGKIKFFFYYKGRGLFFYTDFHSDQDVFFCPIPLQIEKQQKTAADANEMPPLCVMYCKNSNAEKELRCFASDSFPLFGADYSSRIYDMNEKQFIAACGIFKSLADNSGIAKEEIVSFLHNLQTHRTRKMNSAAERKFCENICETHLLLFLVALFFSGKNEFHETALQGQASPVAVLYLSDTAVVFGRKSRFMEIQQNNEYSVKFLLPSLIGVRMIAAAAEAVHVFEYNSGTDAVISAVVCRFTALAEEDRRFLSENLQRPLSALRQGTSV